MRKEVIFGISGTILNDEEKSLIQYKKPHGIILFARNIKSRDQVIELNSSIKDIAPKSKIFVDQEGGRVRRVKPPISQQDFPAMKVFADMYDNNRENALKKTEQNFFDMMTELRELGFDVTCAPVCDLVLEGASNVIGDRGFGSSVEKIVDLCKASLEGIHRAGGEGVLKHIPGHGRALVDSHHKLPVVDTSLEELVDTDFAIFKALKDHCTYAMTAHVIYNAIDPDMPATLSSKVMKYIRDEIGFKGQIMTDALEMKALDGTPIGERAKLSWEAGNDIALYCTGQMDGISDVMTALREMSNLS